MFLLISRLFSRKDNKIGEMFEQITASEIAGFGVGAFLLAATIYAPKIDSFISTSQRSSLGMCKRCGDLRLIACSSCKGSGTIKGGQFNFMLLEDKSKVGSCTKCRARGHFQCPECSM